MTKDWLYFVFFVLWGIQTVLTVIFIHFQEKYAASVNDYRNTTNELIEIMKKESKKWGDYCYETGYTDGMCGRKPRRITKEEVLARSKEKKSAN